MAGIPGGAEGEDLAEVFSRVRVTGTDATQMRWARDSRTRAFCDLGLYLLYQHTMDRPTTMDPPVTRIFARLQASALTDTAAVLIEDPARAEALSVQRFNDTWGRQPAYCEDLVSYLFRTGPYLRRLSRLHPDLLKMAHRMPLGEWIRQSAVKELRSATADPLVAMHTVVEANLPSTTTVRQYVNRLRRARLQEWARLYELAFTAFHLEPREGIDWLGIAERFSTIAAGTLLRARTRDSVVDGEMPGQLVVEIRPALCTIERGEIDGRRAIW